MCFFKDFKNRFLLVAASVALAWAVSGCGNAKDDSADEQKNDGLLTAPSTLKKSAGEPLKTPGANSAAESAPPAGRNVLLIVVDTLRADRLGCYGYRHEPPVTPTMDKLAKEGILFERFYAASPWTGASFASIFTGVSPTVHGGGRRTRQKSQGKELMGLRITPISKKIPTLAELLKGFASAGIAANSFLHPELGFGRGFDNYYHQSAGLSHSRRANETTDIAISWIDKNKDKPFFLMVQYFDPHISYDPPIRYAKDFAPGGGGRFRAPFAEHSEARKGTLNPSDKEANFIRGLYNGEVRFVDDEIGRMLKSMEKDGLLDNTWVILTADHGEEQFDHGSFDHGHRYEDEVTHVPLIIRPPKGEWKKGTRIPFTARHIDLAPTILNRVQIDVPEHMQGHDLMPLIVGDEKSHRPAYMEFNIYWTDRSALTVDGRYKIIRDVNSDYGWFYDLLQDPKETKKLKESVRYKDLEKKLLSVRAQQKKDAERLRAGDDASEAVELPDSVVQSLKALGYLEE